MNKQLLKIIFFLFFVFLFFFSCSWSKRKITENRKARLSEDSAQTRLFEKECGSTYYLFRYRYIEDTLYILYKNSGCTIESKINLKEKTSLLTFYSNKSEDREILIKLIFRNKRFGSSNIVEGHLKNKRVIVFYMKNPFLKDLSDIAE